MESTTTIPEEEAGDDEDIEIGTKAELLDQTPVAETCDDIALMDDDDESAKKARDVQ